MLLNNRYMCCLRKYSLVALIGFMACLNVYANNWDTIETNNEFSARHEAGFITFEKQGYLIGGRGIKPVNVLNPKTLAWKSLAASPFEMHHFQPVIWKNKIIIAGALTGGYPFETPIANIYYFIPNENKWEKGPQIPKERLRGSVSTVVIDDSLFLVGGIKNGHTDGNVAWVDRYNFKTKVWSTLPDAPHARDHAQAVVIDNKIYVAGGRKTFGKTNNVFDLVVDKIDVFNIETNKWDTLKEVLPVPRAGVSVYAKNNGFIVVGGESANPNKAHEEVHFYNINKQQWLSVASLNQGRHGSGIVEMDDYLWIASGSGMQGGSPELSSVERIKTDKIFD